MPRHHADGSNEPWSREDPDHHQDRHHERQDRADGSGDAVGFPPFAARHQPGVHRDERSGEHTLSEQVLQEIWDAKRRGERIGGDGVQSEVIGERTRPDQAGQSAQEDADRNEHSGTRPPTQSTSSSASGSPSVPFAFLIRNPLMKKSMSPSRTRFTSPT